MIKGIADWILRTLHLVAGWSFWKKMHPIRIVFQFVFRVTGISTLAWFVWNEVDEFVKWTQLVHVEDPETGRILQDFDTKGTAVGRASLFRGYIFRHSRFRSGCLPAVLILSIVLSLGGSAALGSVCYFGWEERPSVGYDENGDVFVKMHWAFWNMKPKPYHRVVTRPEDVADILGGEENVRYLKSRFKGQEGARFVPRRNGKLLRDQSILVEELDLVLPIKPDDRKFD